MPSLLEWLPKRLMASALNELKMLAAEVENNNIEEVVGTSRAALAAIGDPPSERVIDSAGRSVRKKKGGAARSRAATKGVK